MVQAQTHPDILRESTIITIGLALLVAGPGSVVALALVWLAARCSRADGRATSAA
jgi:hypothetical protein